MTTETPTTMTREDEELAAKRAAARRTYITLVAKKASGRSLTDAEDDQVARALKMLDLPLREFAEDVGLARGYVQRTAELAARPPLMTPEARQAQESQLRATAERLEAEMQAVRERQAELFGVAWRASSAQTTAEELANTVRHLQPEFGRALAELGAAPAWAA